MAKDTFEHMNTIHHENPVISSRENAVFKKIFSLQTSKGIKENGVFLAGGEKIINEILRDNRKLVTAWIRAPDMPKIPRFLVTGAKHVILSKERFNEINLIGTSGPLLELHLPEIKHFSADEAWPLGCSLFIPFGDPENVGSVIRSAVGMGISRVILLSEAACPFLPRSVRASAGSILRIRLEYGPSLTKISSLPMKVPLYSLDMRGKHLTGVAWPRNFGLIAGMEGKGLPADIKVKWNTVSIPLENGLESLNAAAAVSLALWDWKIKKNK